MIAELHTLQRWCPLTPIHRQVQFLTHTEREVLYAGGPGGGKTTALLMAALQHVDTPGYSALLLRRWHPSFVPRAGLLLVATRWLAGKVTWGMAGHRATFPSGATLSFSSLGTSVAAGRFAGMAFQFIGLDDVEQFEREQYDFLLGRLRPRREGAVPLTLRLRATTGQLLVDCPQWLIDRYGSRAPDRRLVPTSQITNPYLTPAAGSQEVCGA